MRSRPIKEIVLIATMAAVLEAAKIALNAIQNVELVSLLIMLYTQIFGAKRTLIVIYIFDFLETLYWGFGTWVFAYLYVWDILVLITKLMKNAEKTLSYAIASGAFGLSFGFLCAIVTLIIGGPHMMITWWIAGIPYDVIHCIGNFTICMALYQPLKKALTFVGKRYFPKQVQI